MSGLGVDLGDLAVKHKLSIEELSGKPIAIDAMNMLYQFLASIRQEDGTPLKDFKGRVTGHLSGLFYRTAKLSSTGLKPVYVFDGKPPKLKEKTIQARMDVKKDAELKWEKAVAEERMEDAKVYAQATSRLTSEMVEESKRLLSGMGIPWVQAPSEGEAEAAFLVREGLCYASASQDYDSLLFGSPVLLRNLSITGKRKVPRQNRYITVEPERIELEETLSALGVSREELIVVGMLCGTDFNDGIRGVGPKTGLKIVKEHKTLEKVSEFVKGKYGEEFPENAEEVFRFFLNPPTEKAGKLQWGTMDSASVIKLLVDEHDFSHERVEKILTEMEGVIKEHSTQRTLDKWF